MKITVLRKKNNVSFKMNDGSTLRTVKWDELGFYQSVYTKKGTVRKNSPDLKAARILLKLSKKQL